MEVQLVADGGYMKEPKKRNYIIIMIAITAFVLVSIKGIIYINNKMNYPEDSISREAFKLNTVITITIYHSQDEKTLDGAMKVCDKYEKIYSRTLPASELYQLNHGKLRKAEGEENSYIISNELADIIRRSLYYCELSKGAFDITIAPVTDLWDFTSGTTIIPDEKLIKEAVSRVGYQYVLLNGNTITFKKSGMEIDLGAIAKGYIADKIKEYLLSHGVKSALINLGGNVLAVGKKGEQETFQIGIQKPFADRNEIISAMAIDDLSVVSSGIYERYFKKDGKIYHHILDPATGYPYQNGLISVTIISPKSVDGDGLSTTCFALGLEKGMKLIESLEDTEAIFITDDYKLHYTKDFFEHISVTNVE